MLQKLKKYLRGGTLHEIYRETQWIYSHMRPYRKALLLYILLGLAATALSLISALLSKELINAITPQNGHVLSGWRVAQLGITVVLAALVSIALTAVTERFSAKINLKVSNELRAEVFSTFLDTEWQSLQQYHSGDLLTRINTDVSTVAQSVLGWVPTLIIKLVQFVASLSVILWHDPTMALFALITAPITLIIAKPFMGKMRVLSKDMRAVAGEVTSFSEEALQNTQSIKAFNLSKAFRSRLDRVLEKYYGTAMTMNRFSVLNSSLLSTCSMIVSYLCLGWGAYRLWQGAIDFGTMVLFIQLAGYLSASLTALIKLVPSAIECTVAAQRIMTIFNLPRENLDHLPLAEQLLQKNAPLTIHIENMKFSYRSRKAVLENLHLTVRPHEMIAIVGPSGSGKTTLFRVMLGLLTPLEGTAELQGEGVSIPLSPSTRGFFSYVPQDNVIFSGTIADTLRLVKPEATDEDIYAALRLACAEDFVRALPEGIYSALRERGGTLSEGQNQRLAIARAILADAPIMLLDEVTSALDLETEQKVLENISNLSGKTCIISTHRPSVLSLCDHVYRIRDTRLESLSQKDLKDLHYIN